MYSRLRVTCCQHQPACSIRQCAYVTSDLFSPKSSTCVMQFPPSEDIQFIVVNWQASSLGGFLCPSPKVCRNHSCWFLYIFLNNSTACTSVISSCQHSSVETQVRLVIWYSRLLKELHCLSRHRCFIRRDGSDIWPPSLTWTVVDGKPSENTNIIIFVLLLFSTEASFCRFLDYLCGRSYISSSILKLLSLTE